MPSFASGLGLHLQVATECRDAKYLTTHGACVDACPDGTYPTGDTLAVNKCAPMLTKRGNASLQRKQHISLDSLHAPFANSQLLYSYNPTLKTVVTYCDSRSFPFHQLIPNSPFPQSQIKKESSDSPSFPFHQVNSSKNIHRISFHFPFNNSQYSQLSLFPKFHISLSGSKKCQEANGQTVHQTAS